MRKSVKEHRETSYPARYAWLGLGAVYTGFLSVGIIFHFLPPILPVVIRDLGISHGQAGLVMSLFALPGILLSLPGGWLVDRYGERLIGSLGLIVMGGGTVLLGLGSSFTLILLARVLSGVGAMVGVVALQRLVIRLFAGRGLGLPVGISGSAVPVGIIIVLNTAGPLAAAGGWRLVALRAGGVTVVVGLVFALVTWLITRGRSLGRAAGQDEAPLTQTGASFRPIWIAGVVWFCANGAMTAFMTFAPDHFQGLGFSISARGLFTSIPMWTSAALGMVTGWLTDRHGGRALFMTLGMALMGAALMVLPLSVVSPSLIGLLLGLSLAAVVTPTIALPGALLPASHTGRGYGILATCANLGIFVVPPLAGWSRDVSGYYLWPFLIMGVVALVGAMVAEVLRRGRFMPGFSRRVFVAVSLMLLAGCGSQDRYEVVAPGGTVTAWSAPQDLTDLTLMLSPDPAAGDAWSADDIVVGGRAGQVVRFRAGLCTDLRFPVDDLVVGVDCQPDGRLVVATRRSGLWEWSAGTWQQDPSLPVADLRRLARDHLDRLLVQGQDEHHTVWRLADGAWQQVADDSQGVVSAIEGEAGLGTWLVTETHNVLRLPEDGLAVWEDSLGFDDPISRVELAGNGAGDLACVDRTGELWLRQAGQWSRRGGQFIDNATGLFWLDGSLYGTRGGNSLARWAQGAWQTVQEGVPSYGSLVVVPVAGGRLLLRGDTSGYLFNGQTMERVSPALTGLCGFVESSGQILAQVLAGDLFQLEDVDGRVWRWLGCSGQPAVGNLENTLVRDDSGRLLAATEAGLEEWNGTSFALFFSQRRLRWLRATGSGEILFADQSGLVGSLRSGRITINHYSEDGSLDVKGLWRRSETEIDILTPEGLYHLRPGEAPGLAWAAIGWDPVGLRELNREQAVVYGRRYTRLVTGDEVVDNTPYLMDSGQAAPVALNSVWSLDGDRLLAWSPDFQAFLWWDESGWRVTEPRGEDLYPMLDSYEPMRFVSGGSGEIFLFNGKGLARLEPAGGAR